MFPAGLEILFEDKYLLAINKPHGMVTERDAHLQRTLESLALRYVQSKEKYPQKCFIGLPHRLDRPVSGVVLFAKKKSVLKMLAELFSKREISKTYLALVEHRPPEKEGELVHWLVKDVANRKAVVRAQESAGSVKAILQYRFITENESGALLQIQLITGKYHQIRAQLSHIGCPVIGDAYYGASKVYKENSIALHAGKLQLIHPATHEPLEIKAPLPDDELWNFFKYAID